MSAQQRIRRQTLAGSFRVNADLHIINCKEVFYRIVETYVFNTPVAQQALWQGITELKVFQTQIDCALRELLGEFVSVKIRGMEASLLVSVQASFQMLAG